MVKSYKNSKHKWTYIRLALKHWVSPQKVYDLAHGNIEYHKIDKPIMHDLRVKGIIRRRADAEEDED